MPSSAKVTAHGAHLASREGDDAQDTVCKLPLGAGTITVKEVAFPFAEGSRVPISVDVQEGIATEIADEALRADRSLQFGAGCVGLESREAAAKFWRSLLAQQAAVEPRNEAASASALVAATMDVVTARVASAPSARAVRSSQRLGSRAERRSGRRLLTAL